MPLYSRGIGKTLPAYPPQDVVDDLLSRPSAACIPNTTTGPERIQPEPAEIRTRGYATDDVEA